MALDSGIHAPHSRLVLLSPTLQAERVGLPVFQLDARSGWRQASVARRRRMTPCSSGGGAYPADSRHVLPPRCLAISGSGYVRQRMRGRNVFGRGMAPEADTAECVRERLARRIRIWSRPFSLSLGSLIGLEGFRRWLGGHRGRTRRLFARFSNRLRCLRSDVRLNPMRALSATERASQSSRVQLAHRVLPEGGVNRVETTRFVRPRSFPEPASPPGSP